MVRKATEVSKIINIGIKATLISFCLALTTAGCTHNRILRTKLNSYVDALVRQGQFSGSVLVAKNGEILLLKGYGMTNYELDVKNTPKAKFRLGSVSKQFTAAVVMKLQEKGFLKVTDFISKYVPDYPHGNKITIHQLLTHSSGIPDIASIEAFQREKIRPHTLKQLVEIFKNKPLDFPPGERFQYSNSGYMLLSYIIEIVTGKAYETIINDYIFFPLGMNDSGYDKLSTILKNRASGYNFVDGKLVNADYIDMSFPTGAGALYSTVSDLYRWDQALYTQKLLSTESLAEMFSADRNRASNKTDDFPGYGYGWIIHKSRGQKLVEHSGGIEGFRSDIRRYLDDKLVVIVLSNFEHESAKQVSKGLAAIALEKTYEWPKKCASRPLNPAILDRYAGKFKINDDFMLTISKQDNKLFAQPDDRAKIELFSESETEFVNKDIDVKISFVDSEHGKATQLILHDQKDLVAERID